MGQAIIPLLKNSKHRIKDEKMWSTTGVLDISGTAGSKVHYEHTASLNHKKKEFRSSCEGLQLITPVRERDNKMLKRDVVVMFLLKSLEA